MSYRHFNGYMREAFGKKVYKIALSTPFTCPNRDGTKGIGGCIFCSSAGSGNFAADKNLSVAQQIADAKERVRKKLPREDCGFMAYFQSFTSTYGDVRLQEQLFTEALSDPEVVALSVATRPDALPREVLDLLERLSHQKPVFVELGLQTATPQTAKLINRCYENEEFTRAVYALHRRGIPVVVHLILGLPGEDHETEIASLRFAASHPISGVKFHLLHVLKGTPLCEMPYEPLSFEEYVDRVTDLIRYVPPHVVIHRLTGDGDKRELVAPLWSGDKKRVLNAITRRIKEQGIVQGEALNL